MTNAELLRALDALRSTMIAVATGGPRIDDVNGQFRETYELVTNCRGEASRHFGLQRSLGLVWPLERRLYAKLPIEANVR